jgi:hypothetical protein
MILDRTAKEQKLVNCKGTKKPLTVITNCKGTSCYYTRYQSRISFHT